MSLHCYTCQMLNIAIKFSIVARFDLIQSFKIQFIKSFEVLSLNDSTQYLLNLFVYCCFKVCLRQQLDFASLNGLIVLLLLTFNHNYQLGYLCILVIQHIEMALNLLNSHGVLIFFSFFCSLDLVIILVHLIFGHKNRANLVIERLLLITC